MDNLANHPIPQDVTHFQFQLIGNMTVKQFAYLGVGIILGWVAFSLPIFILIKLPFAGLLAGAGVFLAFAPLEGRPADVMLTNFLRAVFSPTVYLYQKPTVKQQITLVTPPPIVSKKEEPKKKTEMITVQNPIAVKPTTPLQYGSATPLNTAVPPSPPLSPKKQTEEVTAVEKQLVMQEAALQQAVVTSKQEEALHKQTVQEANQAHQKTVDLEKQLRDLAEQKRLLEEQLISLQKQVMQHAPQQPVVTPNATLQPTATSIPRVVKVPKSMTTTVGVPLTPDVPNLITGVVKDPRGNVLTNILIEVMDKDNNPVRAFKTNNLGQFASATPLNNGTYTLTLEDPNGKNSFDIIEVNATGDVILPLQITSIDQRELLRKELFKQ